MLSLQHCRLHSLTAGIVDQYGMSTPQPGKAQTAMSSAFPLLSAKSPPADAGSPASTATAGTATSASTLRLRGLALSDLDVLPPPITPQRSNTTGGSISGSVSLRSAVDEPNPYNRIGPSHTSVAECVRKSAYQPFLVWVRKGGNIGPKLREHDTTGFSRPSMLFQGTELRLLRKLTNRIDFLGRRCLLKRNLNGTLHKEATMWMKASSGPDKATAAAALSLDTSLPVDGVCVCGGHGCAC